MVEEKRISVDELLSKLSNIIDEKIKPISDRLETLENQKSNKTIEEPKIILPKSNDSGKVVHIGEMEIVEHGDKADIVCPECGRMHPNVPIPVKEKVVEKKVVPQGYVKMPSTWNDIRQILDLPHPDNHSIFDCPKCSIEFAKYVASNKNFVKLIEKMQRSGINGR